MCTYGLQMVLECIVVLSIVVLIKKKSQGFSSLKYLVSKELMNKERIPNKANDKWSVDLEGKK